MLLKRAEAMFLKECLDSHSFRNSFEVKIKGIGSTPAD
jgi:hypothetical protein